MTISYPEAAKEPFIQRDIGGLGVWPDPNSSPSLYSKEHGESLRWSQAGLKRPWEQSRLYDILILILSQRFYLKGGSQRELSFPHKE